VADQRRTSDDSAIAVAETRDGKAVARDAKPDRDAVREIKEVRASDIEPYTGLRYLSKLFRFMAVIMLLLLVAEVATGVYTQGSASIPTLLGEASRLIVLAGVLWGTGDLAHLLIDVGHDVRAARILVARVAHAAKVAPLNGSGRTDVATAEPRFTDRPAPKRTLGAQLGDAEDGPPIP
jgi:hypothetical protein